MAHVATFELPPEREAAFWLLAEAVGISPTTASALTASRVVDLGRPLSGTNPEGFGAAAELVYQAKQGKTLRFRHRPQTKGEE